MSSPAIRTPKSPAIHPRILPAINRLLVAAMKLGPDGKHNAVNKVLELVPGMTRGDCWQRMRQLRKSISPAIAQPDPPRDQRQVGQTAAATRQPSRRWTKEDDDKLLAWAGYEPVDKIAQRLSRSVRAVRFRLCAHGMSARVTDGWSLRALMELLRVGPDRLRFFITTGMLHVRDSRITASSLARFCGRNAACLSPESRERIAALSEKKRDAYPWERAADLLGVELSRVQSWISEGQLKLKDTFVTDRSLEEFCRRNGSEINLALMDPATAKWLIEEYGVPAPASGPSFISRARKHALKIRTCRCGRKIAGNVYFKHAKACKALASQAMRQAVKKPSARIQRYGST